mmetsp:Transcript_4275/g.13411  ORF Transcript_4275/g.13411 Transcript_4275/m.13411 type:complete len:237 (-) Transcript_4275:994-1704(-)
MRSPPMFVLNSAETDVPPWMPRMAASMSLPTESWRILRVRSVMAGSRGTVLATTTSSRTHASMRSAAGPEKRPCVAKAKTRRAPKARSSFAAAVSVPAVSIMSSTMMQSEPSTLPTRCIEPTTPGALRCLRMTAREISGGSGRRVKPSMKSLARATPPASGETMTGLMRSFILKYVTAIGAAKRLSTGVRGPKKPWICAEWRSTQTTRSTPMASIMRATSAAEMGTRDRSLRSCRA